MVWVLFFIAKIILSESFSNLSYYLQKVFLQYDFTYQRRNTVTETGAEDLYEFHELSVSGDNVKVNEDKKSATVVIGKDTASGKIYSTDTVSFYNWWMYLPIVIAMTLFIGLGVYRMKRKKKPVKQ